MTDSVRSEPDHRSLDELGDELWLQNVVSAVLGTLDTGEILAWCEKSASMMMTKLPEQKLRPWT